MRSFGSRRPFSCNSVARRTRTGAGNGPGHGVPRAKLGCPSHAHGSRKAKAARKQKSMGTRAAARAPKEAEGARPAGQPFGLLDEIPLPNGDGYEKKPPLWRASRMVEKTRRTASEGRAI